MRPIVYDLFSGLHGWLEGFLAEGYRCVAFDIEDMCLSLGQPRNPDIEFHQRDVRSIHGSELKDAAVIVASPPCQAYSYRAMPWKRAKSLPPPDNTLFNECFRIQREASEAAGHYIPLIVENVRGARPWVGRAQWNYGSFYLWGDVPALMPFTAPKQIKAGHPERSYRNGHVSTAHLTNRSEHGVKFSQTGDAWFDGKPRDKMLGHNGPAAYGSKSARRKAASALIAKIPFPLSQHIARCYALRREASA